MNPGQPDSLPEAAMNHGNEQTTSSIGLTSFEPAVTSTPIYKIPYSTFESPNESNNQRYSTHSNGNATFDVHNESESTKNILGQDWFMEVVDVIKLCTDPNVVTIPDIQQGKKGNIYFVIGNPKNKMKASKCRRFAYQDDWRMGFFQG